MQFRLWLEDEDYPFASGIARQWLHAIPKESQERRNIPETWNFVAALTDPEVNGVCLAFYMQQIRFGRKVYEKPISALLTVSTKLDFKEAVGGIVMEDKIFTAVSHHRQGNHDSYYLHMLLPPFVYENADKAVLQSKIMHELRHLIDIADTNGNLPSPMDPTKGATLDQYLGDIMECRAYADQLVHLLALMGGNVDAVIQALKREPSMTPPETLACATAFLRELAKQKMERGTPPSPQVMVETAAKILAKIMQKMRFRNFRQMLK